MASFQPPNKKRDFVGTPNPPQKIALAASGEREPLGKTRKFPRTPGGITPEPTRQYVGRFAPSPTGSLHLGSLVAALGSYADARSRGGRWLLRMEDLDRARVVKGAAERMLRTLEVFGLTWDGVVEYQSERTARYAEALETLRARGVTFECSCSRRERDRESGYPGTCREGPTRSGPTATRFRVDASVVVSVEDRLQGRCDFLLRERGDVIIRRRDGAFAYQLAVVVDDALQGITDVMRGADLLDSTPWQIALQHALTVPTPRYAHLPLVVEPGGQKLAKSRHSVPLHVGTAGRQLYEALRLLRQDPPAALESEPGPIVAQWACSHWQPRSLWGVREVRPGAYGTTV
jgi:glutamyl-Q tRNA(Asp) synthetase